MIENEVAKVKVYLDFSLSNLSLIRINMK